MKWYQFRQTNDFELADIVVTVNENGEEVEYTSDQLQRKEVISWRWTEYTGVLEATIK